MKSLTLSLFTTLFLGLCTIGFAQDEKPSQWCGTQFTEAQMDRVQSVTERYMNGTLNKSNPTYDIPITLHNIRNSDGSGGVDMGIYEGYNFKQFGTPTGYPSIKIDSYSATVPKNSNLTVTIKAKTN